MKILVFIEQRNGRLKPSGLECLTAATKLTPNTQDIAAVIVGKNIKGLETSLKGYGADTVFILDHETLENYNVFAYCSAIQEAINKFNPHCLIGAASPMGRDLFPRLAARLNAGVLTDLTEVKVEGQNLTGTKPLYAGKCLATVSLQGQGLQLATIRPNVISAAKSNRGEAKGEPLNFRVEGSYPLKTKEIRKGKSQKPDLTEASVIISGGRAMANAENFKVLHECADVIGATVGASRAAVDSGYAPHDMQVGQTGKTVNPNLYIACGISGSIQHMAGMRTSKIIVAINTDTEAPIFTIADYGVVGDLFKVVPELTKKFKELLG